MNEIKVFENDKLGAIRTINENEKVLFCGSDVARALGYSNAPDALIRHCRAIVKRDTPISGKIQAISFIPEGDVYRLITHSQLPTAEVFERWVFDEVLPSIRRHGLYATPETVEAMLGDPDVMIQMLTTIKTERAERMRLEAKVEQDLPKVLFADSVSASNTTILVGELAKLLKQNGYPSGQNRLFETLRKEGYLISRTGCDYNMPTQRSMEMGLFTIKETSITHADGHIGINKTPKVTGKGQLYFVNRYCTRKASA